MSSASFTQGYDIGAPLRAMFFQYGDAQLFIPVLAVQLLSIWTRDCMDTATVSQFNINVHASPQTHPV